ncbi:ATP-binding cassette domain-containing protein [Nonomuraea ferruginea]
MDGAETRFGSPRDALDRGIATVYQDLAMIPLMSVWRNFFLGSEPRKGLGFDVAKARRVARDELRAMGIDVRDVDQPVGTLSGGERQSVAIARAVYFGARVLILGEPTSALGVKQAGVVLRYIARARDRGLGGGVHHPQPAPRLPRGGPVPPAQPWDEPGGVRQGGHHQGEADLDDGRGGGAEGTGPRTRTRLKSTW